MHPHDIDTAVLDPIATRAQMDDARNHAPLELRVVEGSPAGHSTDLLVVGAFADGTLSSAGRAVDQASGGRLAALMRRGDLEEKPGASLLLYDLPGVAAERVLLVRLGPRDGARDRAYRDALAGVAKALRARTATNVAVALVDAAGDGRSLTWRLQQASRVIADGLYRFDAPKRDGRPSEGRRLTIEFLISDAVLPEHEDAVWRGLAIADGMALAKDLGNLPANVCNPEYLAETARGLGDELGLEVEVLEREDMARLGMHAALAVGRASHHPCNVIVMRYKGGARAKPIVLVGKGVTFDTGGISLKPGEDMDMMKYDMCGAASVFGAMKVVAQLGLPIHAVGLVNAVENMPGGNATRPGDVVTSMSGQTIEVLNTDAEGRLGLADVLTYAERFDPACVVDVATLTGACVIALGTVASGLFANDDALAAELLECGSETGDRAWQLPLWDEYQEQLRSNFADMSNMGGRPAGSVTAACFLARFAKRYPWAHLDIAGTNAVSGQDKGATGRPVPLLAEFLIRRAEGAAAAATVAAT